MSEANDTTNITNDTANIKDTNNVNTPDEIEETLLWNIHRIEERQKASSCIPDSIEKALAGVEEALTSVQSALGTTQISTQIYTKEEQATDIRRVVDSRDIIEDLCQICDMSPKEDLNLPAADQNQSDPEPVEEQLVENSEAIEQEVVHPESESANTIEKASAAAVSSAPPIMEKPEEIADADIKDEDSEDVSLHESIVIGTVQISDTVHIDQEVYNEKKEVVDEPSFIEEIKEAVIETTSKFADDIAKILDEPEDQVVEESDKSNDLLEAIDKKSKVDESVCSEVTDVEKECVISGIKFAHDLSENRRGSTFLTELDDMEENDNIVEEKVEQIVEKVIAEHSSGPSLAEEVSKEDETVVEKLLEEVQNAPITQLVEEADQTEEISSQTEAIQEISTTFQTEIVEEAALTEETSSTSQTEVVEEISPLSQTEVIEETSSTSQNEETSSTSQTEVIEETPSTSETEVIEETSPTSQTKVIEETLSTSQIEETSSTLQTDPVETTEVFEKAYQTTCSELEAKISQKEDIEEPEAHAEKIEIIEEPIIEILESKTKTEDLEKNVDEKVEELARSICSNIEEPPSQLETMSMEEVPIGALAIAVFVIFLALIIFYR